MLQKTPPAELARKRWVPSRRGFLVGAGATLGLVVGFAVWPRNYPNRWPVRDGETLLNAWLKVGVDGRVTVAVPQAEMGQGAYSGLAQIVADELGADWLTVGVEHAPLHPDYAAVGMVTNGVAGLPPMLRGLADAVGGMAVRRMNLQLTGGSTSVMNYHDILRDAGARARAMLCAAAAKEWDAPAAECDTANGFVLYKANRMRFADAAKLADVADAPDEVTLRGEGQRPLAGKPVLRLDLPGKVDGTARFGGDVRVPGMVFAAIRHAPVNGKLAKATAPNGVRIVRGEAWVAAVGATNWAAQQALAQVATEWSISGKPAGPWMEAALTAALAGDPADHGGEAVVDEGATDGSPAGLNVRADYAVPYLAHACMEPMVATARVSDGKVEVWGPTQSQTLTAWGVGKALGVESDAVVIYPTLVGGGFGRKAETDAFAQAALIAREIGRPVQLQWSRTEDLGADFYRPAAAARMAGKVEGGRIAGWEARIAVPSVGTSFQNRNMAFFGQSADKPNAHAIEGADDNPYGIAAFRAVHVPVAQPVPLGYWRSVGHSFTAFFVESFVDELALAAGADPVAFRLAMLEARPRHAGVLRAVAARAGWGEAPPAGFARGVALHESFGSVVAMVIEAGVAGGSVRINRVTTAIDCGRAINPDSVRAQMEGGAIMGLSAALYEKIGFENGRATATNFDGFPLLPFAESPRFDTVIVEQGGRLGGVGEPGTPPAAPALANALARATGKRARVLPLAAFYTA